jgi:hypothetical protein
MSTRVKSSQPIKFCGTRTDPATKTKSIGLWAKAQVSWFLQGHQDSFIVTRQLSSIYRDLLPSRQITVTRYLSPPTGTLPAFVKTSAFKAKTYANPDTLRYRSGQTHGNSLNRRAVIIYAAVAIFGDNLLLACQFRYHDTSHKC